MAQQQLPDYVQLEEKLPEYVTLEKEPITEKKESFLSRAWKTATTPLLPVEEPTMEQWSRSPMWSATQSALSQATSPLGIIGELAGGIGMLRGLRGMRNRVPQVASTATKKLPTGAEIPGTGLRTDIPVVKVPESDFLAEMAIRPKFNPKGQTGLTGELQKPTGVIGNKIKIKQPTMELINRLRREGYAPGGVGEDGYPFMIKNGKPINIDDLPVTPVEKASITREMYNLPRGLTTSWDISAPLRQGFPLITRKEWWTSWDDMIKAGYKEDAYQQIMANIEADPLFKKVSGVDFKGGKWIKKEIPSFAEKAGLAMTDLKSFTNREEALMSTWAEKVPGVRASNRAYTTFLNKLRADTFKSLIKDAERAGLDPMNNEVLSKEIADFVNTATGRGPLRTQLPTLQGTLKERSLEQAAGILTNTLFSPRLVASRVRMLNPGTYIAASPMVRKEYMKAFLSTVGAWGTVASMAKMSGADVSLDPTNADFGKIRIGNTRLDPAAGFQQYFVLGSRLLRGETTSSTSSPPRTRKFGEGFMAPTRLSTATDFGANKLHPVPKFAYDLYDASEYKPVQMGDRIMQMYVPLVIQDVFELAREDPTLLPLVVPTAMGMGTQTYEKGSKNNVFLPPEMDMTFEGGSLFGR